MKFFFRILFEVWEFFHKVRVCQKLISAYFLIVSLMELSLLMELTWIMVLITDLFLIYKCLLLYMQSAIKQCYEVYIFEYFIMNLGGKYLEVMLLSLLKHVACIQIIGLLQSKTYLFLIIVGYFAFMILLKRVSINLQGYFFYEFQKVLTKLNGQISHLLINCHFESQILVFLPRSYLETYQTIILITFDTPLNAILIATSLKYLIQFLEHFMSNYRRILMSSRGSGSRASKRAKIEEDFKEKGDEIYLTDLNKNKTNIVASKIYHEDMMNSLISKTRENKQGRKNHMKAEQEDGFIKNSMRPGSKRESRIFKTNKTEHDTFVLPDASRPQSSQGRRPRTSKQIENAEVGNIRSSFYEQNKNVEKSSRADKRRSMVRTADNFKRRDSKSKNVPAEIRSAVDAHFLALFAK